MTFSDIISSGYCGNWPNTKANLTTETDCNMTCNANTTQYCGGNNRLSLYTRSVDDNTPKPSIIPHTTHISTSQPMMSVWPTSHITVIVTTNLSSSGMINASSTSVPGAPSISSTTRFAKASLSASATNKNSSEIYSPETGSALTTPGSVSTRSTALASLVSTAGSAKMTSTQISSMISKCCQETYHPSPQLSDPLSTSISPAGLTDTSSSAGRTPSAGRAAGIAVGTLALLGLLVGVAYSIVRARRKPTGQTSDDQDSEWWEQQTDQAESSAPNGGLTGGIRLIRDNR